MDQDEKRGAPVACAPAATRRPVTPITIACRLTPEHRERIAAHWSAPTVFDVPTGEPVWRPPSQADALISFMSAWEGAPAEAPKGWPFGLRWIQLASAGADILPAWAFDGPVVTCARGVTAEPLCEYVFAALLNRLKRLNEIRVRSREDWVESPLGSLAGTTLGLIGLGAIGGEIARRALGFGMRVLAVRRSRGARGMAGVELASSMTELAAKADHLVICAPLTSETHGLVDRTVLAAAKPGLHVINVARGALLDQEALIWALDEGRVAFATLDVTDPEPLPAGHPLYAHPQVLLTPHVAWYSPTHHARLSAKILSNLDHYARGEPLGDIVDPARGY
jgi:phosphoglycerate dehydrogenase-like enzyme